ncbi:MAG TPA: hypothetical protein VFR01_07930 [Geobacterales bacterium]|nr:hypothetical protein [Geobacterales bacterium]
MSEWARIRSRGMEFLAEAKQHLSRTVERLKREGVIAQMTFDLLALKRRLKRSYRDLGRNLYEAHQLGNQELPDLFNRYDIKLLVDRISALRQEIAEKEQEIEEERQKSYPS